MILENPGMLDILVFTMILTRDDRLVSVSLDMSVSVSSQAFIYVGLITFYTKPSVNSLINYHLPNVT